MSNIVFDFDGVMVDSFEKLYQVNSIGAESVNRTLSREQYREAFNGNVHQELARMLNLSPIEDVAFRGSKREVFPIYYNRNEIELLPFVAPLVKKLNERHSLYIVTSAPQKHVVDILDSYDLGWLFEQVMGGNLQGKKDTLSRLLINPSDIFVTDTVGDVIEARGLSSWTYGVSWGFHSKEDLIQAGADEVFEFPTELVARLI